MYPARSYKLTPLRVVWRFAVGRPLDGYPRTDGSFLRAGTKSVTAERVPSRWDIMPGWKRALCRWLVLGFLLAAVIGWFTARTMTLGLLASVTGMVLLWVGWKLWRVFGNWVFRRRFLLPLHYQIHSLLGYMRNISPEEYITLPRNWWDKEDTAMTISFRTEMPITQEFKESLTSLVSQKLGVSELAAVWYTVGMQPYVAYYLPPKPPDSVSLADVQAEIATAPDNEFIIGIGRRNKVVRLDLDNDAPHIGLSAGTGAGKSVFARTIASQVILKGGEVIICDIKGSHKWARDIPSVTYCIEIKQIHDKLVEMGERVQRTNLEAFHDDDYVVPFRTLVLLEEMNGTINELKLYWDRIRLKDDPKTSPAIDAIRFILFMGRSAKVNLLGIFQMLTAKAIGGPEARENIGYRVLARATHKAWAMLAPEIKPIPKKTKKPGRMHIVIGGVAEEIQTLFLTEKEAKQLASGSNQFHSEYRNSDSGTNVDAAPLVNSTTETGIIGVTIREAVDQGILPLDLKAARKASQHPHFPKPVGSRNVRGGAANVYGINDLKRFVNYMEDEWDGTKK